MRRTFAIAAVLTLLLHPAAWAVIDPNSFTTLSPLIVHAGTLTFDTDSLHVILNQPGVFDNVTIADGVLSPQPNGVDLAVFPFDNILIDGSTDVQFAGRRPVALASKGNIQITSALDVSANSSSNRVDFYGGFGSELGPGAGHHAQRAGASGEFAGTGGGFGGAGGSFGSAPGGSPYGNLLETIEGGSGGGISSEAWFDESGAFLAIVEHEGGTGGGGIAIVANGAVSLGDVTAGGNGGQFFGPFGTVFTYGGGGSGGGILLSGSTLNYSSLRANGATGPTYATGGGGGRVALVGTSEFTFDLGVSGINVAGGTSYSGDGLVGTSGSPGVITVSPQTFIATGTHVLDGSLIVQPAVGAPTYEVEVRRNLTVNPGASVTLGKNQPLDRAVSVTGASTALLRLQLAGSSRGKFFTGPYSQRLGAVNGYGDLVLSDGGRITIDGLSVFDGTISGPGTLAVSPGARMDLQDFIGTGYSQWTGTAEIAGTVRIYIGALNARVVSTSAAAVLRTGGLNGTVTLGGDLSDFHGTLEIQYGTTRVAAPGAIDTPANVVLGDVGTPRLDLNATTAAIGSLNGTNAAATIDVGGNLVGNALVMGGNNNNGFYSGTITGLNGGVTKVGTGGQTLNGPLTYLGPTIVREGRLTIGSAMDAGGTVRVESSGELRASASINRPIAGVGASSIISISASQPISLGSSTSFLGFSNQGELRVGANSVTISSAGAARLGGLTSLGASGGITVTPGTVTVPNGAIVDFGEAIVGYGAIDTPNTLAKRVVVNGVAQGDSATNRLTFSGYVKGTGSFDNVTFTGTFSPGLSPAVITAGSLTLASSNTLIMELGGIDAGTGYDKIESAGSLNLGGALNVALLGGFMPTLGNSFDILDWGTLGGTFSSLSLPALDSGLAWNTSQLYTTGSLSIVPAGVPGDYNNNGVVDAADYVLWRKGGPLANEIDTPGTVNDADYAAWRARFGNTSGSGSGSASQIAAVPEPATTGLFCIALGAAIVRLRERRRAPEDRSQRRRF